MDNYPKKKMLTSKTGANSCCYYTPHPDGEHLCYRWTYYGESKDVKTYACAGCRSIKGKDGTKPHPPKSKRDESTETWIINPMTLNDAHYCIPLETSKEQGKQIQYEGRLDIIKNGGSVKAQMRKAEILITQNQRLSIEHHAIGKKHSRKLKNDSHLPPSDRPPSELVPPSVIPTKCIERRTGIYCKVAAIKKNGYTKVIKLLLSEKNSNDRNVNEKNEIIKELQNRLESITATNEEVEKNLDTKKAFIKELRQQMDVLNLKKSKSEREIKEKNEILKGLQQQQELTIATNEQLDKKLEAKDAVINELYQEMNNLRSERGNDERKLKEKDKILKEIQEQLKSKVSQVEHLEKQLYELQLEKQNERASTTTTSPKTSETASSTAVVDSSALILNDNPPNTLQHRKRQSTAPDATPPEKSPKCISRIPPKSVVSVQKDIVPASTFVKNVSGSICPEVKENQPELCLQEKQLKSTTMDAIPQSSTTSTNSKEIAPIAAGNWKSETVKRYLAEE